MCLVIEPGADLWAPEPQTWRASAHARCLPQPQGGLQPERQMELPRHRHQEQRPSEVGGEQQHEPQRLQAQGAWPPPEGGADLPQGSNP